MGFSIEGNERVGFRVVDDKIGPLSGRKPSAEAAMDAAGVKRPVGRPKKSEN